MISRYLHRVTSHILTLAAVLIICHLFTIVNVYSQLPAKEIEQNEWIHKTQELKGKYGENKNLLSEFELASLIALSKYPELLPLKIDVVYAKIKTTMQARPTIGSLFKRKKNRIYKVFINSKEEKLKLCALKNIPFDAQVGALAHEFAHVLHYSSKSSLELIGEGFRYWLSKEFRSRFERANDLETINRGFGWQVYHFTYFILNESNASSKYKAYKRKFYYSPDEIEEIIRSSFD